MANSDDNQPQRGTTPVPPRGGKRTPNRPSSGGRPSSAANRGGQRTTPTAGQRSGPSGGTRTAQAPPRRPGAGSPSDRRRQALAQQRRRRQTLLAGGAIGLVIVVVAVLVIIKVTGGNNHTTSATKGSTNQPVAASVMDKLTSVSTSQLAAAANNFKASQLTYPTAANGAPINKTGKPELLYIGAEYCPYCATERWPMVLALSKFGHFSGLTNIHSSPTDVYPSTQTFSFYKSSFTSQYLKFTPVETETVNEKPLQKPTAAQTAILTKYDPGQSIPFVYFNGEAYFVGAQYNPQLVHGKSFQEIANDIAAGKSTLASNVYANAGAIVSNICKMTGGKPGRVCKYFPKPINS